MQVEFTLVVRNRLSLRNFMLCAMAVVAGCVQFKDQPLSTEKVRASFEARNLHDTGLKSFIESAEHAPLNVWPFAAWNLEQLSLAAFYFHPDLDIARAQLAVARASLSIAKERANPSLTLAPSYDTTTPPPWILGLGLDLPIETAGKRRHRVTQSEHLLDAAKYQLAASAWQVRSGVRKALLDWYTASERKRLLEKQEAAQAECVRLFVVQQQVGESSSFELTQSRVALNQVRFALRDAELATTAARIQLAQAIGISSTALDDINISIDEFTSLPQEIPDAMAQSQALSNRADIRAALAEYAASQSALQREIAKQYPDIHLGPAFQRDQTDNKWSLSVTLELPVFNRHRGAIAEAQALREQSAATFSALQARVVSEINQSIAAYRASAAKSLAAQSLSKELDSQLTTAQGMYATGELSRVELTQRQLELTTAALAQLDALVSAQASLGNLEDVLQSPATLVVVSERSPRVPGHSQVQP